MHQRQAILNFVTRWGGWSNPLWPREKASVLVVVEANWVPEPI
jgi:hypothetical protein